MKRLWSSLFVLAAVVAAAPVVALAQPAGATATAAAAEVKAGTGVENKESVGTASEFAAGTKIWVWSRVTGATPRPRDRRCAAGDSTSSARIRTATAPCSPRS